MTDAIATNIVVGTNAAVTSTISQQMPAFAAAALPLLVIKIRESSSNEPRQHSH